MLMQDFVYMDEMAHFDRERIPERVVHAKGAGMLNKHKLHTTYFQARVINKNFPEHLAFPNF